VISLIQPKFKLQRKHWIHFLPVGVEFIWSNFIKSQNFFWDGTRESLSWLGYYGYMVWMHTPIQIIIAIGLVLYYTISLRRKLLNNQFQTSTPLKSNAQKRLLWTLNAYIGFSILAIISSSVDYFFFDYAFNPFFRYPTFIGMALLTYWLGIQGIWYRNENIFEKAPKKVQNAKELQQIITQLEQVMQTEKPYLNPELNVAALAKIIDTKPYLLTKALNHQLQKKFSDYINEYRVDEVKKRINSSEFEHLTLLAIAYDSGFNSKASFNRIVKKITGQSPSKLKSK
jgi:AraC-like DNA-binding protein